MVWPCTLPTVSRRLRPLPMTFQSFGSLSLMSVGGSILEAASATLPNVVLRPDAVWVMTPFAAVHSAAGTFHSLAAAWISIMRAAAPPLRTTSWEARMPRLPAVKKSAQTRLRATFWPAVGNSYVTFDHSHSSSSATVWHRPVRVPWPISERATRMTTVSSGLMTTQAFTSGEPSAARTISGPPNGMFMESASPPPAAAPDARKARRFIFGTKFMAAPLRAGRGGVNRLAHLLEGPTATDVGDRLVDVLVGRLRLFGEQRRDRHDHPALAVAALRDVVRHPGFLHLGELAVDRKAFDRG